METARGKLRGEISVWKKDSVFEDTFTARGKVYGAGSSEMKQNKLWKTCVRQIKVVYLHHQCRYSVQFKVNGTAKCLQRH